jgi:hypothetical protein
VPIGKAHEVKDHSLDTLLGHMHTSWTILGKQGYLHLLQIHSAGTKKNGRGGFSSGNACLLFYLESLACVKCEPAHTAVGWLLFFITLASFVRS